MRRIESYDEVLARLKASVMQVLMMKKKQQKKNKNDLSGSSTLQVNSIEANPA